MQTKKILFCTDFSENSEPAQQLASEYAKAFGAELLIVYVIDTTGFPTYGDWVVEGLSSLADDAIKNFVARFKEEADTKLKTLAAECGKILDNLQTFCTFGLPAKEIVALANQESVDLIVMGTHGRAGVKHLVMGSVARSVLRMAHRPVLIVEGPSKEGELYEYPVP